MAVNDKQIREVAAALNASHKQARAALTVAEEALLAGLPPLQAVVAASAKVFEGFVIMSVAERQPLMVRVLNALLIADRVKEIGKHGILPLRMPRKALGKRG